MIRRILPLVLIACAGCAADRADDLAEVPAAASALVASDSARPSASPEAYLVWSGDSTNARTAWIDGEGRVVAQKRGIYVAGAGTVWAWTPGMKKGTWIDCECLREQEFDEDDSRMAARCPQEAEVRVADLVDVVGGRRIEVLKGESDEDMAPPEQSAQPLAGVGPYLFVEYFHDLYMCGAHGVGGFGPGVYDLRTGAQVELVDSVEAEAYEAREGEAARAALIAENEVGEAFEIEGVDLTEVEVRWSPEGALSVAYQFTTGACYACSDGEYGSYSRSHSVPAREVIPALRPYLRAPEAVRRYWSQSPPGERAGWSAVDAADPAAALARFRGR